MVKLFELSDALNVLLALARQQRFLVMSELLGVWVHAVVGGVLFELGVCNDHVDDLTES